MRTRTESPEVFYPGEEPVIVDNREIEMLKRAASVSPKKRARLCTHADPSTDLHEMLIVLPRSSYIRPHKHIGKTESFTILEGKAEVILFNEDGTVHRRISMGSAGTGDAFYYRLSQPVFHTIIVRSDFLVFHEVTEGPFNPDKTIFAPWSPEERDSAAASLYQRILLQEK
jgi:cupin fold WbuC family metalloprotein